MSAGIKIRVQVDVGGVITGYSALGKQVPKVVRKAATKAGQAGAKEAKAQTPLRDIQADVKTIRRKGLLVKQRGRFRILKLAKRDEGKIHIASTYKGGLLRKALHYKVKQYRKGRIVVAIVGVRPGFRTQIGVMTRGSNPRNFQEMTKAKFRKAGTPIYADPVKYVHLVDRGTRYVKGRNIIEAASRVGGREMAATASASLTAALSEASRA